MSQYKYKTKGTCSLEINFEIDNEVLRNVKFINGCNGNTKGISALVEGMNVHEVVTKLKGINCGFRGTSCPDQLALAIEKALNSEG